MRGKWFADGLQEGGRLFARGRGLVEKEGLAHRFRGFRVQGLEYVTTSEYFTSTGGYMEHVPKKLSQVL